MADNWLTKEELRERLAALAHDQWSGWMRYQFGRRVLLSGGHCSHNTLFVMSAADEGRWTRQMETLYADLPEAEKDSDRKGADRVLTVIAPLLAQVEALERTLKECHGQLYSSDPCEQSHADQIERATKRCAELTAELDAREPELAQLHEIVIAREERIAELTKQRDDLQAANTREVERRQKAERENERLRSHAIGCAREKGR